MFLHCLLLICGLKQIYADPNFVLIITDDQDLLLDGLLPMKNTLQLVANRGKTFKNMFANSPICCPSRSTILTGKFAHNTGVVNNSVAGNCSSKMWQEQHEPFSIAAMLKEKKHYLTFYAGKYLNSYGDKAVGGTKHVPKGYDWWIGLKGNSRYYNFTLSFNGTAVFHRDYLTDLLAENALTFLDEKPPNKPFFMTVAPPAPHAPFIPAKRHEHAFPGAKAVRSHSFNYSASDKHWLVRMPPNTLPENATILDRIQRHRLQSLLAVDEMVGKIVLKLEELGLFDDTYIFFTSDNGYHIGQFTQPWDKRQPYETDIRIPFIVSGPSVPEKTLETYPVSLVDLAPTILDLADIDPPLDIDGKSFKKRLLSRTEEAFSKKILVEYWGEERTSTVDPACPWKFDRSLSECSLDQWCKCQDSKNNTYICILDMTDDQYVKFCEFKDDQHFLEAYNLTVDPYELKNIAPHLDEDLLNIYQDVKRKFEICHGVNCDFAYRTG